MNPSYVWNYGLNETQFKEYLLGRKSWGNSIKIEPPTTVLLPFFLA